MLLSYSALKLLLALHNGHKILLINFANTWKNLVKNCISVEFLLIEGYYVHGDLRKELHIALFVERFKIAPLGRSC